MTSPSPSHDVAVVGAGPGGLAAACAAGRGGARVALIDASPEVGGQYWRHPPDRRLAETVSRHHHRLGRYRTLTAELTGLRGRVEVLLQHRVWAVERIDGGFRISAADGTGGDERLITATRIVLAPGAYDRQLPFPGWDLPGVVTAGGAQALLKGSDVLIGSRILVAGTGPFLLSVAVSLADAGAHVVGIHDASALTGWGRHLAAVARNPGKVAEGAHFAYRLGRHRVPVHRRSIIVCAEGTDSVESVTVARLGDGTLVPGTEHTIAVDTVAVGWGFTPQLELPVSLDCQTRIDADGSSVVIVDDQQQTSQPGVYVVGEACGVGGAELADIEGQIAGAAAAGTPTTMRRNRRRRSALRQFAAAMHTVHPVPTGWQALIADDTTVCRCEEVPAGALRRISQHAETDDPRSAKLLTRAGMGLCQGRVCGYGVTHLMAHFAQSEPRTALLDSRPVAYPVRLGDLADTDEQRRRIATRAAAEDSKGEDTCGHGE